ncbi:hypothetical protein L4D06_23935 [Enterovibrio makurazakiensis]|uniref:hypothetical protein n=1 Tax=Enterovibrio makurazakiensis TaxID=2910232 RepID=UPI003D1FA5C3
MNKNQQFGRDIAERVYEQLIQGKALDYVHYGYCGVGFVSEGEFIHYTHFDEWLTWQLGTEYQPGGEHVGIVRTFISKSEFVEWLAIQSDHSLSGAEANDDWYTNNQRVTKARLEWFLAKFES